MRFTFVALLALLSSVASLVLHAGPAAVTRSRRSAMTMEYIPDGLSKAQWAAIKKKEGDKKVGKFDGTSGMSFRSRTFEDFQKGRESGKLTYNMPVEFAKQRLASGELKPSDIPYMQRKGGKPDDSDLKPQGFKFPWQK